MLHWILPRLAAYVAVVVAAGLLFLAGASVYALMWPKPVVPFGQMGPSGGSRNLTREEAARRGHAAVRPDQKQRQTTCAAARSGHPIVLVHGTTSLRADMIFRMDNLQRRWQPSMSGNRTSETLGTHQ